jgi:hypothetical protein
MVAIQDNTNMGSWFYRQLQYFLPKVYEEKYPSYWAAEGRYHTVVGDLPIGKKDVVEATVKELGEASIYSEGSGDIPIVNVTMSESLYKTFIFTAGFDYNVFDLERDRMDNCIRDVNLVQRLMKTVQRTLIQKEHLVAVYGSATHGVKGLFNNASVPLVDATTYDADGGSTTFQTHIDFIRTYMAAVETTTNLSEGIEYILVPPAVYWAWAGSTQSGDSSKNVITAALEWFGNAANGSLKGIIKCNECTAGNMEAYGGITAGTNKDRIVFLPTNPDFSTRHNFVMQMNAPQERDLNFRTIAYCGTSETIIIYPNAMRYVDIPKVV